MLFMFKCHWLNNSVDSGTVALGIPIETKTDENQVKYIRPAPGSLPEHMVVLREEDWLAQTIEFLSHLHGSVLGQGIGPGIWAKVVEKEDLSLIAAAAKNCFMGMNEASIKTLCSRHLVAVEPADDMFKTLHKLISKVLPGVSEEQILNIMQKRISSKSLEVAEILATDEMAECFGNDADQVKSYCHQVSHETEDLSSFKEQVQKLAQQFKPVPKVVSKPKPKNKGKHSAAQPKARDPDLELLDEESAKKFIPPGSRLFKDYYNGRWLGFCRGVTRSRSWQMHGDFRAMSMVISWLWKTSAEEDGHVCPYPWIEEAARA